MRIHVAWQVRVGWCPDDLYSPNSVSVETSLEDFLRLWRDASFIVI